jgi:hypothetical protein
MLRVVVIGNTYAIVKEADAAEAITPGHLISLNSTGQAIKHNVAGAAAAAGGQFVGPVRVAEENDIFGKGIDDAYAIGDRVIYRELDTGCEFMALVAAGAPAIVYNDLIESAGNGTVRKGTVMANAIGRATEAVDNSGGGAAVRLRVEVL